MRQITKIIVHCTATPEGRMVTANDIDRWHRNSGWNCIGYHYVVGLTGHVEGGRSIERAGAHCQGHNADSIGIVYVGGLDKDTFMPKDTRTRQQIITLRILIRSLLREYPTITGVYGHRDFARKACPCFDAQEEYAPLLAEAIAERRKQKQENK